LPAPTLAPKQAKCSPGAALVEGFLTWSEKLTGVSFPETVFVLKWLDHIP